MGNEGLLRGGLESGQPEKPVKKKKPSKQERKVRQLLPKSCSSTWSNDIAQRGEVYPATMMPLSNAHVLTAKPKSDSNFNPKGTRGERRHTPAIAVAVEDVLDQMSAAEADIYEHPSSAGAVVDARNLGKM